MHFQICETFISLNLTGFQDTGFIIMTVWRKAFPAACGCDKNLRSCPKPILVAVRPLFTKKDCATFGM